MSSRAIKDDYYVKQRPHLQLSLNMSQRTLYDCARDHKAKAKETRDAQKILSSNIYKRSLTESNLRNIWCNFSDYFVGTLRFQFLMFQTHNSCYKSKELDTNNCVEIMGIGVEVLLLRRVGHFLQRCNNIPRSYWGTTHRGNVYVCEVVIGLLHQLVT